MKRAISFKHPERVPYAWATLPWAEEHYPDEVARLKAEFPSDVIVCPSPFRESYRVSGSAYLAGNYTDEWGCAFENLMDGVIGEVKTPMVAELADFDLVEPPYDTLPDDYDKAFHMIREIHESTDLLLRADCCPRPWERYQFLRGTENAMMDIAYEEAELYELLDKIHRFYLTELEFWAQSDVDCLFFMDDWGTQNSLLIPPESWRKIFKPLYRDYCDIARKYDKLILMHSDGNILSIIPDLVEIGVNALNSQLFSMNLEEVAKIVKGKLALWGEIDRQHTLTDPDPEAGSRAVRSVVEHFYTAEGGLICNLEFGPGAQAETVRAALEAWSKVSY
jgi:hypothetical protein